MLTRKDKLLHSIDPATQLGVEIGALDRPIITRAMGQIRYVDHASTEELRVKYADPALEIDTSKLVEVDYVWGEKGLDELLQEEAPFDYLIASHVIEHVPDLIGWLNEIRNILKPGGIVSLAIPDKRRCFDYLRTPTRTGDAIDAYLLKRRKPSPGQIFDNFAAWATYKGESSWDGLIDETALVHTSSPEGAWHAAKQSFDSGDYCDAHCWVFTPASFFQILSELTRINLLKFDVADFYDTAGNEFHVSLRAVETPDQAKLDSLAVSLREKNATSGRELELEGMIRAMESSKFWKLRTTWFKVKRKLGLAI